MKRPAYRRRENVPASVKLTAARVVYTRHWCPPGLTVFIETIEEATCHFWLYMFCFVRLYVHV